MPWRTGTGKTTIAKIYGKILAFMGMLSKGHEDPILLGASELIGGHEGDTEKKVNEAIDSAMGKVLVIDEAYALSKSKYGKDALDVLTARVQSGAQDLACILCGYEDEMQELFQTCNPGLSGRFKWNERIRFSDYSKDELATIMEDMAARLGASVAREVAVAAVENDLMKKAMKPHFQNAREVLNMCETAVDRFLMRPPSQQRFDEKGRMVLQPCDLYTTLHKPDAAKDVLSKLVNAEHIVEHMSSLEKDIVMEKRRREIMQQPFDPTPYLCGYVFSGPAGTGRCSRTSN